MRSEGFALAAYVVPVGVEDGAWGLWENASGAVAAAVNEIVDLPGERKETSDAVAAMSVAVSSAKTILFEK